MKASFSFLVKIQVFLLCLSLAFLCFYFPSLKNEIGNLKKDRAVYKRFFEKYKTEGEGEQSLVNIAFPDNLEKLSFGESSGLVVKTKKVTIRNVPAPHNGAIIKHGAGYLMFFRYDVKQKGDYSSYIGCVELDSNFDQTDKEFLKINTLNNHSEDPRIFCTEKEAYLVYTQSEFKKDIYPPFISTVNIAPIDLDNYTLKFTTKLDPHFHPIEKNWTPFVYNNDIYFQYRIHPQKILLLPDPHVNHLTCLTLPTANVIQTLPWKENTGGWGTLSGGTPAVNIGNEYLAFFHSSFIGQQDLIWYSMGAYTFENHPPFRVTSMSPYPILFSDIYDSVPLNTAEARKRVIFPASFVIEKKDGKEWIHLSCGENDASIKIITLDKEILLKGLKRI